jgi:hypothetical protein
MEPAGDPGAAARNVQAWEQVGVDAVAALLDRMRAQSPVQAEIRP